MWFFMLSCYGLSLVSLLMLLVMLAQTFVPFTLGTATPFAWVVLTSMVYLFTETLVIFFFVGTGVSVKEYSQEHHLDPQFHRRSIALKRRVYPPQMLNLLLMIVLFVLYGAVDTGKIPSWLYQIYFAGCLLQFLDAKRIAHETFRENTKNILEMSGIKHGMGTP